MPDDIATAGMTEARGLRFPGAETALSAEEMAELDDGGLADPFARTALSVARPADRVLVLGGGSGLIPALLAGLLGVRHLAVVEPDPDRRGYISGVLAENRLVRAALHETAQGDYRASMVVCDLSRPLPPSLPDPIAHGGLRAVVLRLPDASLDVARIFERMSTGGLTYFPRQSSGNVVTFLSRWH